ncbi:MAG: ATP-dependent helicase HrpB [Pseudomonadales bacterium]|nr:ATP-dependent helicase HrpB [Pseudomonadales bacterium]
MSPPLPIHDILPALLATLRERTRLVLEAPPGAGKTTQVPLALLNEPWCAGRKVLLLEPRRVAARAAATFMARQLGEEVGHSVGYRIRFENRVSAATRIEVVTEGILTRLLQDDPTLEGVAAILFDEFHERHLFSDLGLALALDVQHSLRSDLRLLLMSATLDGEALSRWCDAARLTSVGRAYPVELRYFPPKRDETLPLTVKRCLDAALHEHAGDVLVFLPGQREITQVAELLQGPAYQTLSVLALHGDLPVERQSAALAPDPEGRRRVVLATNIAESSVTLPGVRVVLDSGLAREPRFDPNSGFSRLQTVNIALASADQRSGRAGRVAPGVSYRLWPKEQRLDLARTPEINQVDLAPLALELAAWGSSELRFVDAPPAGTLAAARDLLLRLQALDARHQITAFGQRLLQLGTHPRLGAMLLAPKVAQEQALACDLAALIEARDPLIAYRGDDWQSRHDVLTAQRANPQHTVPGASRAALNTIDHSAAQWRKRLRLQEPAPHSRHSRGYSHALGAVLLHAYPDRIGHRHPSDPLRYQLSNGKSARLFEDSRLRGEPWLVISELRLENRDSLILRAAPLDEAHLREAFLERFVEEDHVRWDAPTRALIARRETRFDQIVLDSRPAGRPDPEQAASALTEAVAQLGLDVLPWSDALRQWRIRMACLRQWLPALGLPDLGDAALLQNRNAWLRSAFIGKTRLDALSEEELREALQAPVDWPTRQRIDQLAPTRLLVPSGLERPITYSLDGPPVLAVKLQELFGLAQTPRIAEDRVPLTLHLLSPGGKPLQITQDLRSFWQNTYPEVKKEMKGRYPKHPWPDDPWTATATHRAKPRG